MHIIAIAFGLCLLAGLVVFLGEGDVDKGLVRLFGIVFWGFLAIIGAIGVWFAQLPSH